MVGKCLRNGASSTVWACGLKWAVADVAYCAMTAGARTACEHVGPFFLGRCCTGGRRDDHGMPIRLKQAGCRRFTYMFVHGEQIE